MVALLKKVKYSQLLTELFTDILNDIKEYIGVRIQNLFNIVSSDNNCPLQIVTRRINSIEELLYFADLDITRFAFDGSTIFTIDEGMRALQYKINFIPKRLIDKDKIIERVKKYIQIGHDTIFYTLHPFEHEFRKDFRPTINNYVFEMKKGEKKVELSDEESESKTNEDLFYSTFGALSYQSLKEILEKGTSVKRSYKLAFSKPFTISKRLEDLITLDSSRSYIEGLRDQ